MDDVLIVAAGRSAIGSFGGTLAGVPAAEIGAQVIGGVLRRAGVDPALVDEVIMGQVLTAGAGQNPARQASIGAGLPVTCPAMTINQVCGSGLKASHLAAQAIRLGDAETVIAGGQESMSLAPYALAKSRTGQRRGDWRMHDTVIEDGLWDAFNQYHMGVTAENLADRYGVSRERQDEFAARSQQRALAAIREGRFKEEIVPVRLASGPGCGRLFDTDEHPRDGMTPEGLGRLRPAFAADGTVTAGNASGRNDGAAAVLMMSGRRARALGLEPLARIRAYATAGVDPAYMGYGPVPASRRCLEKAGWDVGELDLVEANEAFAVQTLTVGQALEWDPEKVNVNGGAIALGHPIGASGARILVTLLYEMQRRDAHKGLATICVGGGHGVALAVER